MPSRAVRRGFEEPIHLNARLGIMKKDGIVFTLRSQQDLGGRRSHFLQHRGEGFGLGRELIIIARPIDAIFTPPHDAAAIAFLSEHGLEEGRFLCFLPNLRNAPYWKVKPNYAFDEAKHRRNEEMKEHDHAPLRAAIVAIARETPMKILVCPEDATQMETGKELLVDPLPDDVKAKVVWREKFWLTDEAISTYVRSAGLVSSEMHSPIMAIGHGIPAIVCRFAEQTTKGFMWRDIGLADWLFDLDQPDELRRVAPTALALAKDPVAAKAKAAKAREFVQQRQRETMAILSKAAAVGG